MTKEEKFASEFQEDFSLCLPELDRLTKKFRAEDSARSWFECFGMATVMFCFLYCGKDALDKEELFSVASGLSNKYLQCLVEERFGKDDVK